MLPWRPEARRAQRECAFPKPSGDHGRDSGLRRPDGQRCRDSGPWRRPEQRGQRPEAPRRPALRGQRPLAAATTVNATNAAKTNRSVRGAPEVTSRKATGPNHGSRGRSTATGGNPVALGTVMGSGPAVAMGVASPMTFRPHSPCAAVKPNTRCTSGPGRHAAGSCPLPLWAWPAFLVRIGRGELSSFILA